MNKPTKPGLTTLMVAGALLLMTLAYLNPPEAKRHKEMLITCFVGGEPFYSGPISERPKIKDGSIFITLGENASLEFINGTCVIFSSPG